jgi:hypothetical protein
MSLTFASKGRRKAFTSSSATLLNAISREGPIGALNDVVGARSIAPKSGFGPRDTACRPRSMTRRVIRAAYRAVRTGVVATDTTLSRSRRTSLGGASTADFAGAIRGGGLGSRSRSNAASTLPAAPSSRQ